MRVSLLALRTAIVVSIEEIIYEYFYERPQLHFRAQEPN